MSQEALAGDSLRSLWTDAPDAIRQLEEGYSRDDFTGNERDDLAHFIDHGWLIWKNAIEPKLIDAFVADIKGHHKHPGMFLTTNHKSGQSRLKLSGDQPDAFESLFDLYVNSAASRKVCLHPKIQRFLSLVFQTKPVAFQQLLFQRSNGHQVHQDTSVVAVEDPCLLVATWIALEDVREGCGELGFYDRSHKIPHVLFKDGSKRLNPAVDSQGDYARDLQATCEAKGLKYEKFLARKGDVLFWTADLVHRSHPRSLPDGTSRLSCVTHYCPETTTPFWFRFHPGKRHIQPHGEGALMASMHYALPSGRAMQRPDSPSV